MLVDRKGQTVDEKRIKENADGLNWDALKDECTRDKIWKDMSGKDIAKNFAIVFLLGLLPTVFDLATDSLSIRDFIAGTVYVKHINSMAIFNTTNTGGCTVHSAQCTGGCTQLDNLSNPFGKVPAPFFPFLVIGAKIVALINPGEEWKKFT